MNKLIIILIISIICTLKYTVGIDDDLLDLHCKEDNDCRGFSNDHHKATCVNSTCHCENHDGEKIKCTPKSKEPVHDFRKIGSDCPCSGTIKHTICDTHTNRCICEEDFIPNLNKTECIKKTVKLGEPCESNDQCIRYDASSYCDHKNDTSLHSEIIAKIPQNICMCLKNFTEHNGLCHSLSPLDTMCINDIDCSNQTENSFCFEHKCLCQENYVASINNTKCLKYANYNEECAETNQCVHRLGVGAICDSGKCVCDARHFYSNGSLCERSIELKQTCREHNDCYQYGNNEQTMECWENMCQCRNGYEQANNICVKSKNSAGNLKSSSILIFFVTYILVKFRFFMFLF
uniref:Putative spliceosomal complex n=1 Tax=Corethrella appendiculata TaxID=1370023 RepID=U5EEV9_9DIPT